MRINHNDREQRIGDFFVQLTYDFNERVGTSAAYIMLKHSDGRLGRKLLQVPRKIGLWVYGDGKKHWLRGTFIDTDGKKTTIDFTEKGELNWVGWKYVTADIPSAAIAPITVTQLYVVETENTNKNSGVIYFSELTALYHDVTEDVVGPSFSHCFPAPNQTIYANQLSISAKVIDEQSGVDPATIRCFLNEVLMNHQFHASRGQITIEALSLSDGTYTISMEASDLAGNEALPKAEWCFHMYTGPDLSPPTIHIISPTSSMKINSLHPRIAIQLIDEHSGINWSKTRLYIDQDEVSYQMDDVSSTLFYIPEAPCVNGTTHTYFIVTEDCAGNSISYQDSFTIQSTFKQPQNPTQFQISIIGDGGYFIDEASPTAASILLKEQLNRINREPSELIGYTGDIVEYDHVNNYKVAEKQMSLFHAPYVMCIGNHEVSGSGSRSNYYTFFGETVFFYEYGNALIVSLDTASLTISLSDHSQWLWLEEILKRNKQKHIFIFMHVPPDEKTAKGYSFQTGHGFQDEEEATRFYTLLGQYKESNPLKNIFVFSGDLHGFLHKEVFGVQYIITGGGGKATHISAHDGGYYHYINVYVDGDHVAWDVIPLLESIRFRDTMQELKVGQTVQLHAMGTFMTSYNNPIELPIVPPFRTSWHSNHPAVLEVDEKGKICGRSSGEATITLHCGWQSVQICLRVVG